MKTIWYPISKSIRILTIVVSISLAIVLLLTPALADTSAGSISGTVKDASGSPLANISVNAGDNGRASTDTNGNYVIRGLPFGQYSVISPGGWASNDGTYIRQTMDIAISATSPDVVGINFVLVKGGSISGTVKDASGSPLANISVNAGDNGRASTDTNGNYVIRGLPFGQYSVISPGGWASNDGTYIRQTMDIAISATSPDVVGINFVLVKGGSISGTVKDASGSPLANISVNAGDNGRASTDTNGNYVIRGLPFGQYSVISPGGWASNDGTYIRQTMDIAISATSPDVVGINFVLVKGGSISGTVKDASGSPLANISVNAGDNGRASTDTNGNYVIRGLPFGQYSVISPGGWASNDGTYIRQTMDIAISATSPDVVGINFVLVKGGSISGTVKDASGSPLANISVNAGDNGRASTDTNGNYVIRGLPFGQYSVISPGGWASNDGTYIRQTMDIAISATSPDVVGINFVLVKGGSISGTVKDASGSPLANISVNAGDNGRASTDTNGNYVIRGLPFGQYSVISPGGWASNDGTYIRQTMDIAISATSPDVVGINFVLVKGGSISGTVKDASGSPLANISVNAGNNVGALTDANGNFIISVLPFGQYSVISPGGWGSNDGTYIRQTKNTAIYAFSPDASGINFVLVKGGSISGTVKDASGSPLANISVNAGNNVGALTDANGNFIISVLPFGQYSVISPGGWGSNDGTYIRQTKNTAIYAFSPDASGINFVLVKDWPIALVAVLVGVLLLFGGLALFLVHFQLKTK